MEITWKRTSKGAYRIELNGLVAEVINMEGQRYLWVVSGNGKILNHGERIRLFYAKQKCISEFEKVKNEN